VAAGTARSGGRAAMTGQGLHPPAPGTQRLLPALADRFALVDVRDAASAQLLGAHHQPGVDDAFLDLGPHLLDPAADPAPVLLCLQSDLVEEGRSRIAGYALATLREWGVKPGEVGVVEGIPGTDQQVYDLLRHELPGARLIPFQEIWTNGLPAREGQTWISTRFHMHLIAAAAGAAGVAVSVKPGYYATKHRSLIELGSGWELAENLDILPPRPTGALSADIAEKCHHTKRRVAAQIYP
ncbi:MAG TPA: polysaccharide pyruvyl transferase family protein, partial [Pseudonocardiaceae bacterium]|nr:polysaccharide pyruvyl transferase family protein [Pseudonocardiaceae bacterium]